MEPVQLAQLEQCCQILYDGGAPADVQRAHALLLPLVGSAQCMPQLQYVLAHTTSPHALIFSATGLQKLVTAHWNAVSEQEKEQMRSFLLDYLAKNGPDLYHGAPKAVPPVVRLLCRVVKLSWLEGPQFQNVTQQVGRFLQSSPLHWVLGLAIYTDLTSDMQPVTGPNMCRCRRIALNFRDSALPNIFTIGIQTLEQVNSGAINVSNPDEERWLMKQVLQLVFNCLSFDFLGAVPDETSGEQSTVMVPHSWNMLRDEAIPQTLFALYGRCCGKRWPDSARLCLQCLVLLASLRRSFFQKEEERVKLFASMMQGTTAILSDRLGLDDGLCYHELSRLLGKLNAAHQLSELCLSEHFQRWVEQVYNFTMDSLQHWEVMPNSKHYLLGFWSAMAIPMMALGDKVPQQLEGFVQQVTSAYVESRLLLADVLTEALEGQDPLEDEVLRSEQLEVLSNLGRLRHQDTARQLLGHLERISQLGQTGAVTQGAFERKAAWLIYMLGALVGGPTSTRAGRMDVEGSSQSHLVNGEVAGQIFRLIALTDQQNVGSECLELAYLHFLEHFRKVYVGEHAKHVAQKQLGEHLAAVLGLQDENSVLGLLISKIGVNLQRRFSMETVFKKTLLLFHELAAGIDIVHAADQAPHLIVSGRLLLKNELVRQLMGNHTMPGFLAAGPQYGRYRTMYYHTLAKLLFMEIRDDQAAFERFMQPLASVLDGLLLLSSMDLRKESCRAPLVGLCRDLRGIGLACNCSEPYCMLFDWLVENPKSPETSRIALFSRSLDVWWDEPQVTTPLLKLMSEVAHNKAQRITFEQTSPSGILLLREAARALVTYGSRMLQKQDFQDVYSEKYKGIGVCLQMISHVLHGNYANFGVLDLYGDASLADCMAVAVRMCLSVPLQEMGAYLKGLKPCYFFLELSTRGQMQRFMEHDTATIVTLLRSVEEGLLSFDTGVSMQCCGTVDNVISYFHQQLHGRPSQQQEHVRRFLGEAPQCFQKLLFLMLQLVMTGEFASTWSISRPLLGLLLLQSDYFLQVQEQLIAGQIEERREKLRACFADLMKGVESSLSSSNKDTFTRNLYTFAEAVRAFS